MTKTIAAALLMSVISTMLFAQGADTAAGKTKFPKVTAEDMAACKNEIVEFNRLEIAYWKNQALDYCTKGKPHFSPDNCNNANEMGRLSSSRGNLIAWFMKGDLNGSCMSNGDYACFGLYLRDEVLESSSEKDLRDYAALPLTPGPDNNEFENYAQVVEQCSVKVVLAKLDRSRSGGGAGSADVNKPNGPLGPVIGTGLIPGATVPAGNAPGPAAGSGLAQPAQGGATSNFVYIFLKEVACSQVPFKGCDVLDENNAINVLKTSQALLVNRYCGYGSIEAAKQAVEIDAALEPERCRIILKGIGAIR